MKIIFKNLALLIVHLATIFHFDSCQIQIVAKASIENHAVSDTLTYYINSWIDSSSLSFENKSSRLDSLYSMYVEIYGDSSVLSSVVLHKKGVLEHFRGYDGDYTAFDKAISYYQRALDNRMWLKEKENKRLDIDIIKGYYTIGMCYEILGLPHKSITYLIKGLDIAHNYEQKDSIIIDLFKLSTQTARTFDRIGDFDQAIKYYANIIQSSTVGRNDIDINKIIFWKARAFKETGGIQANDLYQPEIAIKSLNRAVELLINLKHEKRNILLSNTYNNKGIAYYRLEKYDTAIYFFDLAIKLNIKIKYDIMLSSNYLNLALTYIKIKQIDSAILYMKRSEYFYSKYGGDLNFAKVLDGMGDIEFNNGNFIKSIEYDNRAINQISSHFKPLSIFSNPSLKQDLISDKAMLLISLSSKARTLVHLFKLNKEIQYLNSAFLTYEIADQVIRTWRTDFQAEASRISLASYTKPIYEGAIETCYNLYCLNQQDSILDKAFEYSEKSRAIVLLDAVRKSKASSKVREALIREERNINLKVNYFEKQAAIQEQSHDNKMEYAFSDSITRYRRKYQSIIDRIHEETPEYYNMIFKQETISLKELGNSLEKNQSFIEYFVGDSSLFTFLVNQDTLLFLKNEKLDSIKAWSATWVDSLSKQDHSFMIPSYKLYQELLAPLSDQMKLSENLIIAPDGVLNQLNFEALIKELPEPERIYLPDIQDYLIYDHQICYAFSASTLLEGKGKEKKRSTNYLGVAPKMTAEFYTNQTRFDQLEYNIEEIKQAGRLFSNKALITANPAKDPFIQQAPKFNIIHCATHALANNENGDLSYILFGESASDILYAKDLYALDLNADLVVLSACQTNAGKIHRGEGVIGLARAFAYAGASSVVTSLWDVREKTNTEIIFHFFQALKNGETKDEALRKAKMTYLSALTPEHQYQAHPYFWAPLIIIGDTSPTYSSRSHGIWAVLLIIMIVVLVIGYIRRKQKSARLHVPGGI